MKTLFTFLILICSIFKMSFAQPVSDKNKIPADQESGTISSFSIPANSSGLIIGCMSSFGVPSMTFAGNPMKVIKTNNTDGIFTSAFYYVLGRSVSVDENVDSITNIDLTFVRVSSNLTLDKTTPINERKVQIDISEQSSRHVPNKINDLVGDCLGSFSVSGPYTTSVGANQTEIYPILTGKPPIDLQLVSSHQLGAATPNMVWSAIAIPINTEFGFQINTNLESLPEDLISFEDPKIDKKTTDLNWQTVFELHNKKFEIEESQNGQVNRQFGELYPNPSKPGIVSLNYSAQNDYKIIVSVFDVNGKLVVSQLHEVLIGNNKLSFDFSDLNTGLYFVEMKDEKNLRYRKIRIDKR